MTVITACEARDAMPATPIADLPAIALVEELRIGSLDDPEVGFTSIGDVWISPAGEVYVSETRELEIRAYSSDGTLLRSYGREGDGPGEFRSIYGFGVVGDTVWVSDGELHRTTLFSLDGEVLATVTALLEVPIGEEFGRPLTVSVFPNALRQDGLIESVFVRAIRPNLPDSMVDVPRVLFDRNGQVVDTLEMVPTQVSRTARVLEFGNSRSYIYPDPPAFDSGTYELQLDAGSFAVHWAVDGDPASGSLVAVRRRPDGDTVAATTLAYDPKPVTESYLDSLAAARARGGRRSRSDSLALFEAYKSARRLPPHHVPIRPPIAVGDGRLWVRLDPDDAGGNSWLILRGNGQALGSLTLRPGAFPRWGRQDTVWIVERDGFDVPWLVRYRLVAPAK
jgi:hypothetical protein